MRQMKILRDAREIEGFAYHPCFLDARTISEHMDWIEQLTFSAQVSRGKTTKRKFDMFGFAYTIDGRRLSETKSMPVSLETLVASALPKCPSGTQFDQCIVTRYPPGAGIRWHTDAPAFDDCIIGVSFGGAARLLFREAARRAEQRSVTIVSGSLYDARIGPLGLRAPSHTGDVNPLLAHIPEGQVTDTISRPMKGDQCQSAANRVRLRPGS